VAAAFRAFDHVVAERYDAGACDDDCARQLRPALLPRDSKHAAVDPSQALRQLSPVPIPREGSERLEDWVPNAPHVSGRPPVIMEEEWVILGFRSQTEPPTWQQPRECYYGSICSPRVDRRFFDDDPERMIPWSWWYRGEDLWANFRDEAGGDE
jgi:hypothetical protein